VKTATTRGKRKQPDRLNPKTSKEDVIVRASDESGRGRSEEVSPPTIRKSRVVGHRSNRLQAITQDTAIRNLMSTRSGN
jgi:hypothetical protein